MLAKLKLELTDLSDDRQDTGLSNIATSPQEIVIINDDFAINDAGVANALDTGLDKCLENGLTAKNPTACGSVDTGYSLQDAEQTTQYAKLAYTYINESGEPVVTKPTQGNVCIQDNNTGYIWTQTIVDPDGYNGFDWTDNDFPGRDGSTTNIAIYKCGFSNEDPDRSWSYASVADLLTILDAQKLRTQRNLGLLVSDMDGNAIEESGAIIETATSITGDQNMRYWTYELCDVEKYFTVDFLTGEVSCEDQDLKRSVIGVYK